jgi:DNA-binding MarR family transcriptional regulator
MSETATDPPALAEELHDVTAALVRLIRTAAPESVTLSQLSVLKRLDREGPRTVAELARADKITHQSVAAVAAILAEHGFVERSADPADARRRVLAVTAAGRAVIATRRRTAYTHLATLLSTRLSPADRTLLAQALPLLERLL